MVIFSSLRCFYKAYAITSRTIAVQRQGLLCLGPREGRQRAKLTMCDQICGIGPKVGMKADANLADWRLMFY